MDISVLEAELVQIVDIEEPIDRAIASAAVSGALAAQLANQAVKLLEKDFTGSEAKSNRLKELILQTEEVGQWCCLAEHFEPTGGDEEAVDSGHALMTKLLGLARLAVETAHKSKELERAQAAAAAHLALAGISQLSLAVRQMAEKAEDLVLSSSTRTKMTLLEQEAANLARLLNDRCQRILNPPELALD